MQLAISIPDDVVYSSNENQDSLTSLARQKIALELYKKHKISISQAANLYGDDIYTFMKIAGQEGIECIDSRFLEDEIAYARGVSKS